MQAHSPAGGAPAGHGGGLSPSDPSSVLALSGGHRDLLAQKWLLSWCVPKHCKASVTPQNKLRRAIFSHNFSGLY